MEENVWFFEEERQPICLKHQGYQKQALGRYIKALVSCINQIEIGTSSDSIALEHLLEKCSLYEFVVRHLFKYVQILDTNNRLVALEGTNKKMRECLKNPKLSNTHLC
ncbi:hypothetical protein OSB04_030110 [Centaurea solstitialis]|uniref:Uncharacterized protein n=1 Tax=Centaurea solstitialis TaxID=347529 RepID=A0AA38VWE0_9ASTR|nr:hypothetical protein OSB04_030110 [Centaurea solstitialis]